MSTFINWGTGVYQIRRTQTIKLNLNEAWDFFRSPDNLKSLTPDYLNFEIISAGKIMYPGMIIIYKVRPLFDIPLTWVTEITHVEEKKFFVDEQRVGPYRLWHHEHHFIERSEGTEIIDIVTYKLPFGVIGRLLNWLLVERKINAIFDHRSSQMKAM